MCVLYVIRYAHCALGACVPNPSHLVELYFLNALDLSITNFYLLVCLGVV